MVGPQLAKKQGAGVEQRPPDQPEMDWQFAFERAEMLRQFQAELLASIGHELRTPLSSQMGSLQMILADLCDSPQEEREYLDTARLAVENSLHLLEEYTRLAQHQIPIQRLQLQPVQLLPLLQDVAALTILQAQDRGLRYAWSCLQEAPITDYWGYADPHGLLQALLGLCRWSIAHLRCGHLDLQMHLQHPQILLTLNLWGLPVTQSVEQQQRQYFTWRVSQRLLREMQANLNFHTLDPSSCQIKISLLAYS
ncbi:MAG: HAMP domain-containing histidine kinase [Synechococcaceae cyanobacterium SM2_3_1]|nr:HAMP domain-containing histidine kinase [Synechococcaceae cyanobacterium SM2_3_1]